jgi:FAD/FMN-containing dehydrogenase
MAVLFRLPYRLPSFRPTHPVGYGTMRAEWIQNLEVVLMDGSVIQTKGSSRASSSLTSPFASRLPPFPLSTLQWSELVSLSAFISQPSFDHPPLIPSSSTILTLSPLAGKSSTGWDTGRLFLGSEGTLGIITRVTVRLAPVVPLRVALTSFPTVAQAVSSVVEILTTGLTPTSLELLDGTSVKGLNMAKILPQALKEEPTVLMRFSALTDEVNQMALAKVGEIVGRNGGSALRVAKDEEENELLWKARKVRFACLLLFSSFADHPPVVQNQYWSQQLLIGEGCRTLVRSSSVSYFFFVSLFTPLSSAIPVLLHYLLRHTADLSTLPDHRHLRPHLPPRRVRRNLRHLRPRIRSRRAYRRSHRW